MKYWNTVVTENSVRNELYFLLMVEICPKKYFDRTFETLIDNRSGPLAWIKVKLPYMFLCYYFCPYFRSATVFKFSSYERQLNNRNPWKVEFQLKSMNAVNLDEEFMDVTIFLILKWTDPKLSWNVNERKEQVNNRLNGINTRPQCSGYFFQRSGRHFWDAHRQSSRPFSAGSITLETVSNLSVRFFRKSLCWLEVFMIR